MRLRSALLLLLLSPLLIAGCSTLQQFAALRQVEFAINDVEDVDMAGVDLDRVRSYEDIGIAGTARLGVALARGEMPLSFVLNVGAENPAENAVAARLLELDWTLLLDDTETISGIFNDDRLIEPGTEAVLPISMELDLIEFFGRNLQNLVELGLAVAGEGQQDVALRASPTVNTPLGPIRYPGEITIVSTTVGG